MEHSAHNEHKVRIVVTTVRVSYEMSLNRQQRVFVASCCCGWQGVSRVRAMSAQADKTRHENRTKERRRVLFS